MQNKNIKIFIEQADKSGERLIDVILECGTKFQIDPISVYRYLTPQQKEKLEQQERKNKTIK